MEHAGMSQRQKLNQVDPADLRRIIPHIASINPSYLTLSASIRQTTYFSTACCIHFSATTLVTHTLNKTDLILDEIISVMLQC